MGKPGGFLEQERTEAVKRPIEVRIRDFHEVEEMPVLARLADQGARCLDCGIPFCHSYGCPLLNRIPDFNDLVFRGKWRQALEILESTNNFPEITGRICPAPCEAACTLAVDFGAVSIRRIELALAEKGWDEGWIAPRPAATDSGRRVAVVGSGPAGLAAAQELARRGHRVTVFEKAEKPGGLLRYGIPDFKLEKRVLDRRLEQLQAEGITFQTGVEAGVDVSGRYLRRSFDAILLATGAAVPRDLEVPGRDLGGVHFALEYLVAQNLAGEKDDLHPSPNAEGKRVVVIGGGDTGSDCVGTARRQGALHIRQIELLESPPENRQPDNPWPSWPRILRTSTSQEEGCERLWALETKALLGEDGKVTGLSCVGLDWSGAKPVARAGSETEFEADLVLLALGFLHTEHGTLVRELELPADRRGNLATAPDGSTKRPGIFAAGDAASGASLAVRAIASGRRAAAGIDAYLS